MYDECWPEEWPQAAIDAIESTEEERDRLRDERDRLRVECEAWRSKRFFWTKDLRRVGINRPNPSGPGFIGYFQSEHDDIDAAVDALMAEMEVTP